MDHYGPDDVSRTGGMTVPGHPHTGLQTVSWLFAGEVEHRGASLDLLNSPAADDLQIAAVGEVLTSLAALRARLTAAHAVLLRRFDAADGHDADGYATSSAWLAAKAQMTPGAAKAAVAQTRQLTARQQLHEALARQDISESWAAEIIRWTRRLPAELRAATDKILAGAAAAGASLDDLAAIAAWARTTDPGTCAVRASVFMTRCSWAVCSAAGRELESSVGLIRKQVSALSGWSRGGATHAKLAGCLRRRLPPGTTGEAVR